MTTETESAAQIVPIDYSERVSNIRDPRLYSEILRYLISKGGSTNRQAVFDHLDSKFTFSEELLEINKRNGQTRWWTSVQFHLVALRRAGFFERSGGKWKVTEEGRQYAIIDPDDMFEETLARYSRGIKDIASVNTWRVKANEDWSKFLEQGFVGCGWRSVGNTSTMSTREIEERAKSLREDGKNIGKGAARQIRYMRDMPTGATVIATDGFDTILGIGRVTGPYYFTENNPLSHRRPVEWLDTTPRRLDKQKWKHRIQPLGNDFMDLIDQRSQSLSDSIRSKCHYWTVTAGTTPQEWKIFQERSIISCNFYVDQLPVDVTGWSLEEIYETMRASNPDGPKPNNNALGLYNFANVMSPGDVLIAKSGSKTILGIGVVKSDYQYFDDETNPDYSHIREVDWVSTSTFEAASQMARKSLTDVTQWTGFASRLAKPSPDWNSVKPLFEHDLSSGEGETSPIPPSRRVADSSFLSEEESKEVLHLLKTKRNLILQGAPGTGKTYLARQIAKALTAGGTESEKQWELVQFHQSYGYEDFIEGFRPDMEGKFTIRDGIFKKFCRRAASNPDSTYVFIIDEINRGNLSRILGELMVLLEHDKRDPEFAMQLAYSGNDDDSFYVPANVMILGLMNTADRSLAVVDYALRRRFGFYTLPPRYGTSDFADHLVDMGISDKCLARINTIMTSLNSEISNSKALGRGFVIGHSFFCPRESVVQDEDTWVNQVLRYEIQPLLEEYCGTQQALLGRLQAILDS